MREVRREQGKVAGAQPPQQIVEWRSRSAARSVQHFRLRNGHPEHGSLVSRGLHDSRSYSIVLCTSAQTTSRELWWFHHGNRSSAPYAASAWPVRVPFACVIRNLQTSEIMEPASPGMPALPDDVLIVEDDPIIALDFEDTILGLRREDGADRGKRRARAADDRRSRAGFCVARCRTGAREKFCGRRAAGRVENSRSPSSPAMAPMSGFPQPSRNGRGCRSPVRPMRWRRCCRLHARRRPRFEDS